MISESVPAFFHGYNYGFRECACSFFIIAIIMVSESVPAVFLFVIAIIMVSENVPAAFCYGCMASESVPAVFVMAGWF